MKTFNLIKWLWTDSHEKQSPQRFARYAAILVMLLTLGVGQMWADNAVTVYCAINASTMKSGDNCYTLKVNANIGDGGTWRQYTMNIVDKTKNGKLIYSATIYEKYGGVDALQFQLYQGSTWKAQKQPYSSWTTSSTFSGKMYDYDAGSWGAYSSLDAATTVYFVNTSSWGTPKAFAWSGCTNNAAWSGQTMTSTGKTYNGKTIYSISFNKRFENIIFSNNGSSQTADQTLGSTNAGKMYDNGTWRTYNYDVTVSFNLQGHGSAIASKTVVKGSKVTAPSDPSASGYTFGGWYKEAECTNAWNFSSDVVTAATTLFAKWTETMSTVSFVASPTGKGTFKVGGSTVTSTTAGVSTTRSVTAYPISGYHFVSWAITGGATISSTTTNPTTVTGGGAGTAATLTATFAADDVYSLTVAAGTGISAVTGSTNDIKAAQNIAITATVATGYTWNTWTKTGAGSLSTFTAGTKNQTVTVGTAGDITLTASATENMSTLSTSNHYDAGDPSYSAPSKSVSSIGISTTADLTAAAPGTGYTFAGWTLSSNIVVTSGNAATDRSITIRTNGNGAAATAQANYTEDLSSPYTIKGGTNITGNNWSTAYNMTKKSGHSTESVVYYTFNISSTNSGISGSADDWSFKVIKDGSTWYGLYASGSYWWGRSTSANQPLKTGTQNIQICADVAGPYEIKVDYTTPASPKVTVTFPTSYTLTYSIGSVAGTSGSISTSPTTASGSKVLSGTNVTLTGPAAKTGYTWKGWYTNAAGTEGKIADTDRAITVTMSADKTLYACYSINNHAITHSASSHGTYTIKVGSAAAVSTNTTSDYGKTITLAATPATGYHFGSWSAYKTGTPATTVTVSSNQFTMPDYPVTVGATFTPKTYTITLHEQGATTHGSPSDGGEITVTYDANTNLGSIASLPERTGYTFNGYYDNAACTGSWIIKTDKYFNWDGTYINSSTGVWKYDGDVDLYAKWVANQYTVTLDVDEANKGNIASATTSQSIYYDDATVTVPNRPTAANGYALDGYYTEQLGAGTKVINGDGTWIASVEGYTDASKHWIHAGDVTLYAYYKKAEITAITFDAAVVEASRTVSFAVTVSPTPTGTTKLCFTVLHSNDNPLAEQPTITYNGGTGKYSFTAPEASGTYKVEAVLRTGSSCAGGTELDTEVASFQVAGTHTVTVRYKCGGEDIKAATALDGIRPLNWSDAITAPNIIGYSFTGWSTGDGVSLTDDNGTTTKTSTTEADIKIKAIYDGYLTANYSKKRVIYFNNTLGWENVYVYFYKNGTYWDATYGTGCNTGYQYTDYPFSESLYGQMLPVEEGSKIYYFDAEAAGVNASYQTVVFTELDQHTYNWFSKTGNVKNKVIKRDDYYSTKLPMYVPLAVQTPDSKNGNTADYYWQGYWMNYPENTGYTLKIYNQKATDGAVELKSIPFEFTADKTMPMELDVDLEAGKTYGFKIYRNDGLNTGAGSFYGNTGTMTANAEGWDMKTTASSNAGLQTTAAGSYKFVLNFYEISSDYQYRVSVTYPVAVGDYRIVYTDGATWSGSAHGASWNHPSGVIAKNSSATETKKDTVSFFWSYGSSPAIGYQTCSSLSAGSASWSAKTAISVSDYSSVLTKTGVYNFIFEQPAGGASISLVKVEPYTGNYYIRTDVANSKWDNYRTDPDHVMTYSDYSIDHGGYSHYYCHWVQTDDRKNMKFVIANDYSPCISDTLIRETASGEWANIATYIESNGDIKRNANVRYMWNQSTNVISRAYIDGAQEKLTYFLEILSDDDKIRDPNDYEVLNEISFNDIENWVYEQNIQAQPGAQIKLRSTWGAGTLIEQYFKGSSSATEQLIGGSGSAWYDIRVIYDFKTNRLIASYIPVDENITTEKAIEADIMFIREHQGDIAQLTFGENGKITKIETAYGVMRFNKWTLNNLSKTYPHNPLSSPASIYERSLFYISFPFRVKLSDVIGFGTYGVHWAVQRYDGAARAQKGHFQENGSFWKWMNRNTEYLEPNQGYLLAIDLDLLGRYSDIWGPTDDSGLERRSERLEIYFPSYGTMPDITNASVTCSIPEHPCTINWYEEGKVPGPDTGDPRTSYNRTIFDSHWNVMSVPTYVNTNAIAFANTSWVTTFGGPNFLYTWNANDNTIAATSATGFEYHAMHSYMVQYGGNVTWTARSGSPAGIVASKTYAEQPSKVEFRLELQQDSAMIDRTFVALSNDEETSAGFRFGEDLTKEFNANKANIYTFIADEATAAGNTLPMSDQTTIVPVGVDIKTNGDYTFAIPDGTNGIGVTLIDTENNIRTSLSALSYTVNLTAGTHDGRFLLEIAPIQQTPTDIDLINGENGENGVRKMLIDQQMYIIRDGKIYDARGARVQ